MITATMPVRWRRPKQMQARARKIPRRHIPRADAEASVARALRILVAVGLTAFLLWQSDPAAILAAGRQANPTFIAIACALVFVDRALMAYRWLTLLSPLDPAHRPRFAVLLRVFLVSTFLGTFLPASVGGDALRAYGLSRQGVGGADALASVLMDRLLGVMSILLVAAAGSALARGFIDVRIIFPALAFLTAACALALAVVFSPRVAAALGAVIARLPRGQQPAHRLVAAIQRYAAFRGELANVLVCSVAVQALRVLQTVLSWSRARAHPAARGLFRAGPDNSAHRLDADHHQRSRNRPGGIRVALRTSRHPGRAVICAIGVVPGDCGCGKSAWRGVVYARGETPAR